MLDKLSGSLLSPTVGFLLKLFAVLTTAAFGILGVGAKTREDNGRLNPKGWIALIGILVGGLLAVGTSVYEFQVGQLREAADRSCCILGWTVTELSFLVVIACMVLQSQRWPEVSV